MPHNDPIVDLGYARYRGCRTGLNVLRYLGLPYAEPPIGERRFRKPVPLDTDRIRKQSNGTAFNAREYPDFALQGCISSYDIGGAGSEDCLKLDIYINESALSKDSPLPVLVYIHGGGYRFGTPKSWPFDHWVRDHPIIVVSIYYRLSVLGFLCHPKFNDSGEADLNVGIWDQVEALQWVKKNISSFGGDPSKMSAPIIQLETGISDNNVSGRQRNQFRGAIVQSLYRTPVFHPEEKEEAYNALVKYLGCEENGDIKAQLARLREISAIEIMQAADKIGKSLNPILCDWKPVIDGNLIHDYPVRLMEQGKFVDVPIIVGATSNEALMSNEATSFFSAINSQFPNMAQADVEQVEGVYGSSLQGAREAIGEALNRSSTSILGEFFPKAYAYRYNYPAGQDDLVQHSADNWILFDGTVTGPNGTVVFEHLSPPQLAFSKQVMAYLVSFIRTGDPNSHKADGTPAWSPYEGSDPKRMVLGEKTAVDNGSDERVYVLETVSQDEIQRGKFWIQKVDKTQN